MVDQRSNRMPSKQLRSKKASLSYSQPLSGSSSRSSTQATVPQTENFHNMSAMELIKSVIELNHDPAIENMLIALSEKIPMKFADLIEGDKRSRSIVISGLEEGQDGLRPSARQRDLEDKVAEVLVAVDVECRPVEIYRMGKPNSKHPRVVKVVLPSRVHRRALASARLLRDAGFPKVFIRRSMTEDERKREYELRQEARERNKGSGVREWVVYHGQLKRAAELPHNRPGNL
uniref:Nucleic-acid-binding protein from transposon X-element n=1 Tax=Haemonchus placei TaxID=6290 RepID=A0A0N4WGI1_HAEPC